MISVSVVAVLIKVVGFFRDIVVASYYGATNYTDAFFFASSLPAMIFPAVCVAFSTAFLSIYTDCMVNQPKEKSNSFASQTITWFSILAIFLGIIASFFAPSLVALLAPGFDAETAAVAALFSRVIMPSFVFIMLIYMFSAVLNANQYYIGVQVSGLVSNLAIIIFIVALYRFLSIYALLLSFVAAQIFHAAILFYLCKRQHIAIKPSVGWPPEMRSLLHLVAPILISNSILQINEIVDKIIASNLPFGSISALAYSQTLSAIVFSIFVLSITTVLYPKLSEQAALKNQIELHRLTSKSVNILMFCILPISIITFIQSKDIVSVIYFRGSFDATAVENTSNILKMLSVGFLFYGVREILARAFLALKDSKTPMLISVVSLLIGVLLKLAFFDRIGVEGIALVTSLSFFVSAILSLFFYNIKIHKILSYKFLTFVVRVIILGAVVSIAAIWCRPLLWNFAPIIRFLFITSMSAIIYLSGALLLKLKPYLLNNTDSL